MQKVQRISYHPSLPRGFTKEHMRRTRQKLALRGFIDIHHIVPRQHRNHPTLQAFNYDVEAGYNFCFMPTRAAENVLLLRDGRPIHYGGHPRYNQIVGVCLDRVDTEVGFISLLLVLHKISRGWISSSLF